MSTMNRFAEIQQKLDAAKADLAKERGRQEELGVLRRNQDLLRWGFSDIIDKAEGCIRLIDGVDQVGDCSEVLMRNALISILDDTKFTMEELGREIGIAGSTVWNFLHSDNRSPRSDTLSKIEKYLSNNGYGL